MPLGAPDLEAVRRVFADFVVTVASLRDPKNGCPWDLKQNHATLRRYLIEEAYEAADAMAQGDRYGIREELGDVLLQVVLNSQIALDEGTFSIVDVVQGINDKMRRRHPHVFGTPEEKAALTVEKVRRNWDIIKAEEKANAPDANKPKGFFHEAEAKAPATLQALKIGKIAAKLRFDWDTPVEVFAQVRSEVDEVEEALHAPDSSTKAAHLAEEIGDLYFSLGQLCRHLSLDPETVSIDANRKFLRRFASLEVIAKSRHQDVTKCSRDELEALWRDVKALERIE